MGALNGRLAALMLAAAVVAAMPWPAIAQDGAQAPAASPAPKTAFSPYLMYGRVGGAGFLAGADLVVGTTAFGAYTGATADACLGDAGTDAPEIYVFNVTRGGGCRAAWSLGVQRDVLALATARLGRLAVAGLTTVDQPAPLPNVAGFTIGADGTITSAFTERVPGTVRAVAMSETGTRVAVLSATASDARVSVLRADGRTLFGLTESATTRALAVSPDGRYVALASGSDNATRVRVFDTSSTQPDRAIVDARVNDPSGPSAIRVEDDGDVVVGSASGRVFARLASGAVHNVTIGNAPVVLPDRTDGPTTIAASGAVVAGMTRSRDGIAKAWNRTLDGPIRTLALGDRLAFASGARLDVVTLDGALRWSDAGGGVLAVNGNGTRIAQVADAAAGGTTVQQRTILTARIAHADLALVPSPPTATVGPGATGRFNVTVENAGSAVADVLLSFTPPRGVTVELSSAHAEVAPGGSAQVNATFTVAPSTAAGDVTIRIDAAAPALGAATGLDYPIRIASRPVIEVKRDPGQADEIGVTQGGGTDVRFTVHNTGNAALDVTLSATQTVSGGPTWSVTLAGEPEISLAPGSLTPVVVRVDSPPTAANGTRDRILLNARSGEVQASAAVDVVVNPVQDVRITPARVARLIAPGGSAQASFTVENVGTVPATVTLQMFQLAGGSQRLPVDVTLQYPRDPQAIAPGSSWPVVVVASISPRADNTTVLTLRAVTERGVARDATLELTANPDLAPPPADPPQRREPLPPLLALVALLGAVLVARRWAR